MTEQAAGDRRRQANRANAKFSTGPKSRAGKARSSSNALRHGLNLSIWSDPTLGREAEAIARRIAGSNASGAKLELARRIGAAQVDINRIRALRTNMISGLQLGPDFEPPQISQSRLSASRIWKPSKRYLKNKLTSTDMDQISGTLYSTPFEGAEKLAFILAEIAFDMSLDRYERRAISRRKSAIRQFDGLAEDS